MKTASETSVTINSEESRFELKIDGKTAFMVFVPRAENVLLLTHTEVPPSLEGQGVGTQLVKGVFNYLEENNLKMVPLCPFVAVYLKRHPEYNRLVAPGYQARP
ncbi:GNAT family N-acetyltransferase [Larkinella soli]|uniref:GNAT family N-acetyltransferase n=1 Tax=Larkinella soli TaxID=1770527 RepID=UPI000FFBDAAF|nr:GNAT family N-acetyltransferase [Larkinella soli]